MTDAAPDPSTADPKPEGDRAPETDPTSENRPNRDRDVLHLSQNREPNPEGEAKSEAGGKDAEGRSGGDRAKRTGVENKEERPKPPSKIVFAVAGLLLLAAVGWGGYSHWRTYQSGKETQAQTANRAVDVRTAAAKREDQPVVLTLPAETEAFDSANIYARATGYIERRRVDIGSRVKQGDLLVHIGAPDLDQQLAQAQAQLGQTFAAKAQAEAQVTQAEANVNLAKVTFNRTNQLTNQGYETLQNRDNQQANVESQQANVASARAGVFLAEANIKAQQATIDRLKSLTAFEDLRAPFDGVITSRSVDTGDLLNADTLTATPLFTIARDDVIRVMVRVPQNDAVGVKDGVAGEAVVPQMPGRVFKGKVTRSSGALLYSSRTLTTELDIPNPDGVLKAGLYVTVTLHIPRDMPDVVVPAEALIFNQKGLQVATVEGDQVTLHKVEVLRDHGTSVELRDGLKGGERIVLEPPALLTDGAKVKEHRQEDDKTDGQNGQGGASDKQANAAGSDKAATSGGADKASD